MKTKPYNFRQLKKGNPYKTLLIAAGILCMGLSVSAQDTGTGQKKCGTKPGAKECTKQPACNKQETKNQWTAGVNYPKDASCKKTCGTKAENKSNKITCVK